MTMIAHLPKLPVLTAYLLIACGCSNLTQNAAEGPSVGLATASAEWALVIHGGAGASAGLKNPEAYETILYSAIQRGSEILAGNGSSLEAITAVVQFLEHKPQLKAGRGAVFNHRGDCELDASIMDGATLNCGAVSGVTTIKNPILLARKVMTESRHVFLVGRGAEIFAKELGFEKVSNNYFKTEERRESWQRALEREAAGQSSVLPFSGEDDSYFGTVGAVAIDLNGNLAAATSTGGLTNKRYGRVGDSPIIGAGTYADNSSVAVSCTGQGELFIRHGVAKSLAALCEYADLSLEEAAMRIVFDTLPPDSGGLIAVDRSGNISMTFNTPGMYRACANSEGLFQVGIGAEMKEMQPTR